MRSISEADVHHKKVILRVDYNVPILDGRVTDIERIKQTVPTIERLLSAGASLIILSHLGRPKEGPTEILSLKPVAVELSRLLDKPVRFVDDIVGRKAQAAAESLHSGEIMMLENLRTDPREEANDSDFAKKLSALGEIFVQDAFANAHRSHASMVGIPNYLPSFLGLLFQKEYAVLSELLTKPKKPFVVIVGGKKIDTKLELLKNIIEKADIVIVGGGIANTFIASEGYDIGRSFFEEDYLSEAEEILQQAQDRGVEILMPEDVLVAKRIADGVKPISKNLEELDETDIIVDIGPRTISSYAEPIRFAGSIFWNGPVGISEFPKFATGTTAIANWWPPLKRLQWSAAGTPLPR